MTTSPSTPRNRLTVLAAGLVVMLACTAGNARALSPAATEALENPAANLAPAVTSELQAAWRALTESIFRSVFAEAEPIITSEITTEQLDGLAYLAFKATAEGPGEAGCLIIEVFYGAGPQAIDQRYGKWFEPMALGGEEIRTVDFPADRAAFTTLAADFRQALYWQSGEIYMEARRSTDVEPLARAWHESAEANGLYDFPRPLAQISATTVAETMRTVPTNTEADAERTPSPATEASLQAAASTGSDGLPVETTQDTRTVPEDTVPRAGDASGTEKDQLLSGDAGVVDVAGQWTELERVDIVSDSPKTFETMSVLEVGKRYRLVASGTFSAWGGDPVGIDAVWCDRPDRCTPPQSWQQLRINNSGINELREAAGEKPLAYNPEHVYELEITGEGKPLSLHFWDSIEVGSAGDNTGALEVRLYSQSKPRTGVPQEAASAPSTLSSALRPASGPLDTEGREATEWIWRDVLPGPRPEGGIRLAMATVGRGCDAKEGNLTWNVAQICDGHEVCELMLDELLKAVSEVLPGCDPDITLGWRCGSHPESFELRLEAGDALGRRLRLTCGRESAALGSPVP